MAESFLDRLTGSTATAPAPALPSTTVPARTSDTRIRSYVDAALARELDAVRTAPAGSRNHQLNVSALALGKLVAAGHLDHDTTRRALGDADTRPGDDGRVAWATIDSGLAAGMRQPRHLDDLADREAAPWEQSDDPFSPHYTPPATVAGSVEHAAFATVDDDAAQHASAVLAELRTLRARAEARAQLAAEQAGKTAMPALVGLGDFLAEPDEPTAYRIDRLWPIGGRVLLAAQYKAGKSTMIGNVLRSLVDGTRFLGEYEPATVDRVVLVDDELDPRTLRRWLRDLNIANRDRVDLVTLRGRVSTFNLPDPATRRRWAETIGRADVLVLDCLRPVLDALALSEDKDAGRFLVAFDALLAEARIGDALVVHHAGHGGERARGDSRLRDWPDAEWRMLRDGDDPAAPRYFTAFGRDVDERERRLRFEPLDRSLWLDGGSRTDGKVDAAVDAIVELLATASEALSGARLEQALAEQHPQRAVRQGLRRVVADARVLVEDGPRGARLHYLNPSTRDLVSSSHLDATSLPKSP